MTQFQLIVRGNHSSTGLGGTPNRGDCIVIDLDATTAEDAAAEARRHLVGDPSKWTTKNVTGDNPHVKVTSNRVGDKFPHGVLLDPHRPYHAQFWRAESVLEAWIAERHTEFLIDSLVNEMAEAKDALAAAAVEADPEFAEYLRLHKKFKATHTSDDIDGLLD